MTDKFEVDRSRLARQSLNVENWEEDSKLLDDIRERGFPVTTLADNPLRFIAGVAGATTLQSGDRR